MQFRTRSLAGRWSAWEAAAPEAEDQPDVGHGRARAVRLVAARQPVVGRPVGPDRVPAPRQGDAAARVLRLEPARRRAGRTLQKAGAPAIVPRSGWNADESIRRAAPSFAPVAAARARPPHRRRERLLAAQSPAIVRAIELYHVQGKRLERHRLQLPRRPLRPGLRGPLRRDRAERRRRARGGVQHRLGRRRACSASTARCAVAQKARDALARCSRGGSTSRTSTPRRRSPSSRAATPASRPAARLSPHGLRAPRHRLHRLPGEQPSTAFSTTRGRRRAARPAEALRADRHRRRAGPRPLQGAPLGGAAVDDRRLRRGRASSLLVEPASGRTSTGRGTRRSLPPGRYSYAIRLGGERHAGGRDARGPAAEAALSVSGLAADPRDGLAERRRGRGRDDDHVHADLAGERHREGARRASAPRSRRCREGLEAGGRAAAPLRPGLRCRTGSTRSSSRRRRPAAARRPPRPSSPSPARSEASAPRGSRSRRTRDGRADRIAFRFELAALPRSGCGSSRTGSGLRRRSAARSSRASAEVEWDGAKRVGRLLDGAYEAVVEATDAFATSTVAVPFIADTRQPKVRIVQRFPLGSG